eukprot:scaffold12443_cov36-Phaeocystis_antarctica.AAC.1
MCELTRLALGSGRERQWARLALESHTTPRPETIPYTELTHTGARTYSAPPGGSPGGGECGGGEGNGGEGGGSMGGGGKGEAMVVGEMRGE